MDPVLSGPWWVAAGKRALRTAIIIALPYLPAAMADAASYWTLLSAAVLGAVLSVLTSLAGIKETSGIAVPYWYAIFDRVVRTVAQALVAAVGNAVLFTDVHWSTLPALIVASGIGSLLLGVLTTLPEADHPVAQVGTAVLASNAKGREVVQSVPAVETNVVAHEAPQEALGGN